MRQRHFMGATDRMTDSELLYLLARSYRCELRYSIRLITYTRQLDEFFPSLVSPNNVRFISFSYNSTVVSLKGQLRILRLRGRVVQISEPSTISPDASRAIKEKYSLPAPNRASAQASGAIGKPHSSWNLHSLAVS